MDIVGILGTIWAGVDQYVNAVLVLLGLFRLIAMLTPTDKDDKLITTLIAKIGGYKKK